MSNAISVSRRCGRRTPFDYTLYHKWRRSSPHAATVAAITYIVAVSVAVAIVVVVVAATATATIVAVVIAIVVAAVATAVDVVGGGGGGVVVVAVAAVAAAAIVAIVAIVATICVSKFQTCNGCTHLVEALFSVPLPGIRRYYRVFSTTTIQQYMSV